MGYQLTLRPDLCILSAADSTAAIAGAVIGNKMGETFFKDPLCFLRKARQAAKYITDASTQALPSLTKSCPALNRL
jgi:hypothetical protein